MAPTANESWLVYAADEIIQKMTDSGEDSLASRERLVHILWVVDCGMRNAGDLAQAELLHTGYKLEASQISHDLGLLVSHELFLLPEEQLAKQYFEKFEAVCTEIRAISPITGS
ncbi:MAG: hypothetical protein R8J94_03850 [Acidimicrobiia bacterium]|nr:hypothetical protein [Acidimicrobiia bacterium]